MPLNFQGFILRPPRTATSNAATTAAATSGVARDIRGLPSELSMASPPLVDVAATQYKAAILTPAGETEEYLLWAANTSNLTIIEGTAVEDEANGTIVTGTNSVYDGEIAGLRQDGSDRIVFVDKGNRDMLEIISFDVERGDGSTVSFSASNGDFTFNASTGVVVLDPSVLGVSKPPGLPPLSGGLSRQRGDRIINTRHTLKSSRFWWTKNDADNTRFTWNGRGQRWEPIKGSAPRNLGLLLEDGEYILSPQPNVEIGDFLPGNSDEPDSYSMIRVGSTPGSTSIPVAEPVAASGFGGIKVVADDVLADFDFATDPTLSGVVGRNEGTLKWNPSFVAQNSGQEVFYSYRQFDDTEIGDLGRLLDAKLTSKFIAPIPGPTEQPFIRIGSRAPLEPILTDTDAEVLALSVSEGQVGVSLATGLLKFSDEDIAKTDPDDPGFDIKYLGARVFYAGVSLTRIPLTARAPVRLLNGSGDPASVGDSELFIPNSVPGVPPGISGVRNAPDGTGTTPNNTASPGIRPNGSGLVRELESVGDLILFTDTGVFDTLEVVDKEEDLPEFDFKIRRGRAVAAREPGSNGSKVKIGTKDRSAFSGEAIYFLQADVTPALWNPEARMFSRKTGSFTLEGDEIFRWRINNKEYVWEAANDHGGVPTSQGGVFSAQEIATSLQSVISSNGNVGEATVILGRLAFQTPKFPTDTIHTGEIEIGFGTGDAIDISGASALGFLPGWILKVSNPAADSDIQFLSDSGASFGLFRSPVNLNRSSSIPDFKNRARLENEILTEETMAMPVVLLDNAPLEDEAGYDDGVFFAIQDGLLFKTLDNFEDVYHQFGGDEQAPQPKFSWADTHSVTAQVEQPTSSLDLQRQQVISDTLHPNVGGGLLVSEAGGPLVVQEEGDDFILPGDGQAGQAVLVNRIGGLIVTNANGSFTAGQTTFTDGTPDLDFQALGVKQGYKLKVTSTDAAGYYDVRSVNGPGSLEVNPAFPVTSDGIAAWDLYEGAPDDSVDGGVLADVFLSQFNHLPTETFIIKTLDLLGQMPADAASQEAGRLVAVVSDAIASNRPINIRVGLPTRSPTISLRPLTKTELGPVANGVLFVPDAFPASERFANNTFSIRVGTESFTFASGKLKKIADINDAVADDEIGVLETPPNGATGDGELKFGASVISDFSPASVFYIEEFSDPDNATSDLPAGTAEFKVDTGELNFSASDLDDFDGFDIYFEEQMVTEAAQDVTISPINGGFTFTKPLREGQIVEATYFQATESGALVIDEETLQPVKVIEFLPVFVRLEDATPVPKGATASNTWAFNPDGKTIVTDVTPQVFVNGTLIGFNNVGRVNFKNDLNQFDLDEAASSDDTVQINYAVAEAFGGETSYTASAPPVYRPPFFIEKGSETFTLVEDRTSDMVPGRLLRIGAAPFYVVDSSYNADADETTVKIFPTPIQEAGTRSPGNDVITALSVVPVATEFSKDAKEGFFLSETSPTANNSGVDAAALAGASQLDTYEPAPKNSQSITFFGDVSAYAITGHLLEVGGYPFIITDVETVDRGRKTKISVSTPTPKTFVPGTDKVKISVRPVYQPSPRDFLGRGEIVPTEPFELVLFGETDDSGTELPGRVLRNGPDYTIDLGSGNISLADPVQAPLSEGQFLWFRRTEIRTLKATLVDDVVVCPRYQAGFSYVTTPSDENGFLAKTLRATYSFSNPDSFYARIVPLESFLAEVAENMNASVSANNPSSGPPRALGGGASRELYEEGNLGLEAQLQDLKDQDRAARAFLSFYNDSIVAFEQILEAISGGIVGDRDGKFRYFLGRGLDFTPPGYEDPYSGDLNARNLYVQRFLEISGDIVVKVSDPLVDPEGASLTNDELDGPFPDADRFRELRDDQIPLIRNDVDDVVLFSRSRPRATVPPFFFPKLSAFGRFRRMGEAHSMSRIYPEEAKAFTLTGPGIGADLENNEPGVYARRKAVGSGIFRKRRSTKGKAIATIGNPVLGTIEDIQKIEVGDRFPSARIFAYSRDGFPDLDAAIGTSTAGKATVIATVLELKDFPIDGATGFPDVTQLQTNGGDLPDLNSGNPDLLTPPWIAIASGDKGFSSTQIVFGRPTGAILDVGVNRTAAISIPGFTGDVLKSIFIGEVQQGCVITFVDDTGSDITSGDEVLEVGEDGASGDPVEFEKGDTIFVGNGETEVSLSDPPTTEELEKLADTLPGYRVGFDVVLDGRDGELVDNTYRSFSDPSLLGFKELFGQKPPKPMSYLEMDVKFRNSRISPVEIPALLGQTFNDDGDYTIPYLSVTNTEIQRLQAAQYRVEELLKTDTVVPNGQYPDEIVGNDGEIQIFASAAGPPSVLLTSRNALPIASGAAYSPGDANADLRSYDFLLVETNQDATGLPAGSQGILSVGGVESDGSGGSIIYPPRFITPTYGKRVRYEFENIITFVNGGPEGLVVGRSGTITTFDGTGVTGTPFFFNSGGGPSTGGLNVIVDGSGPLAYPANDNIIRISLFRSDTGAFLQTVVVSMNGGAPPDVTGDLGSSTLTTQPQFFAQLMSFNTPAAFVTIAAVPGPGELPEDPGNPGFSIPLWFTIDVDTTFGLGGSTTAEILDDRVTFQEAIDLRSVLPRGTPNLNAQVIEGRLRITTIETPGNLDCTVNSQSETNDGNAWRFEEQDTSGTTGTFSGGIGQIRVPAWEGKGEAQINATGVNFSGLASTSFDTAAEICTGTGFCESELVNAVQSNVYWDFEDRVAQPTVVDGALENIQPGDVLVIKTDDSTNYGTTKAGTYLVRYVIEETDPGYRLEGPPGSRLVAVDKFAGDATGFAHVKFPSLVESDVQGAGTVTISNALRPTADIAFFDSMWSSSGRLYFIIDKGDITQTISIAYTSHNAATGVFTVTPGSGLDADGSPGPADSDFDNAAAGTLISGFIRLDCLFTRALDTANGPYPTDYVVGYRGDGNWIETAGDDSGTAYGFFEIEITNPTLGGSEVFPYTQAGGVGTLVPGSGLNGELNVVGRPRLGTTSFVGTEDYPAHRNAAAFIDISHLSATQWDNIHGNTAGASEVNCLFPEDEIQAEHRAQAAIFLEPSIPRPVQDYNGSDEQVVDDTNSFTGTGRRGFRSGQDFGLLPNPADITSDDPENIFFEVRRVRRWHSLLDEIATELGPLRYAYEIRRGTVATFGPGAWPYVLTAAGGTQLGAFDDADVNIRSGDTVRILDPDTREVLDSAEIASVEDGTTLFIAAPGFTKLADADVVGKPFQVFINTPPVPHEQSNEQLLELMTDEVVLNVQADYTTQDGGFVPVNDIMQDKQGPDVRNFPAAGVRENDIVLIDPARQVQGPTGIPATGQEFGARPFGDTAVPGRAEHDPGRPSPLDDNRGFYFVTQLVGADGLRLDGQGEFAGNIGQDVLFGSTPDTQYAVYPTVRLAGFEEGQATLRKTAYAGEDGSPTDSFKENFLSVAPFSYQVIRPSSLFTREAQELILFMRERTLSWIEELGGFLRGTKNGSYFVFQRDNHITDVGDPNDPNDGLGVPSNDFIEGMLGLTDVAPFANTDDCLSILDRRYWILDTRLDTEAPAGSPVTYATFQSNTGNPAVEAGEGRPVLPDLIDDVLTNNDRLRELRFAWLDFRANLRDGLLAQIDRFEAELPRRKRDEQRLLRLNQSMKGVTS